MLAPRSLAFVGCLLLLGPAAQAQQRSLFGNRGPLAGPDGFATGSLGPSPAVQARSGGMGLRYQPGNSFAPTGMFDRQGSNRFGAGGLTGNFSRSLVGYLGAGPSFNNGIAEDDGVPRLENGVPVESPVSYVPVPAGSIPAPSLPVVFPQEMPIEAVTVPIQGPAPVQTETSAQVGAAAQIDGSAVVPSPAGSPRVRPALRTPSESTSAARDRRGQGVRGVARQSRPLSRQARFRDVTIGLEGGFWTLRGEVDSFESRDLAEAFAALEPGVGQVRNEITVRKAEASAE